MEDIRNEIVDVYMNTLSEKTPEMSPKRMDFETVKDHLTFRVVEINRNRDYLSEKPYALLGNGLAAVCDVKMYEELDGIWQTTVTNDLAEKQDYTYHQSACSSGEARTLKYDTSCRQWISCDRHGKISQRDSGLSVRVANLCHLVVYFP